MTPLSRRSFVKAASASVGALTLPRFNIASAANAGYKIRCAVIGVGGMGGYAVSASSKEKIVAFCDVDDERATKAYAAHPDVPRFKDFRVMFDKMADQIDVVLVSTPDHTHFPAAMAAIEHGKHIFIQKPLAHNLWQNRTLQTAVKHYGVLSNMGNQGHCLEGIRYIKEWYDAGLIGEVQDVRAWTNRPGDGWYPEDINYLEHPPVPETLDWDLWLGPKAHRKYSPSYMPGLWRGWWNFGSGGIGDIGCHLFDAPFWTLNLGTPGSVELEKGQADPVFVPKNSIIKYSYKAKNGQSKRTFRWQESSQIPDIDLPDGFRDRLNNNGIFIIGSKGTIYHEGIRPNSPQLVMSDADWKDFRSSGALPPKTIPRVKGGPIEELFREIKGGPKCGSNFNYAVPLTEMALLGVLAQRTGKTIKWDAKKMKAKGHPELDRIIKEPTRPGWSYGEGLWS